ncbi:aldehyde dehydrogenase family protein [Flavobacterium sp.]|jgi:betaine-aldehyde dehydrogenase|uniref:aldehyde dehydrogenase family protein n=1 Tax=Flavobacterium sp. TaxID=239 RepID=UPI0022C689F1|nr:aldehyde dehydrogenase family protein [Flavobacterium sp.]MCZ8228674.1 aldehyde dehydrogenase family protein [Flavobacterium sp.]
MIAKGFFIEPTIFTDVTPNMRMDREEIFEPVVALLKFSTEEEAIAIANDTEYGLGYGLFTQDVTRVHRVMPKIRDGIGWVNFYHPTFKKCLGGITNNQEQVENWDCMVSKITSK